MDRIIEELYYGNIRLSERYVQSVSKLANAQPLSVHREASMEVSMSNAQKEIFQIYVDCTVALSRMAELNAFALGFRFKL